MLWTKRKYIDEQFGELEYSGGCWYFEISTENQGRFTISVEGSKKYPSEVCLESAREILSKLDSYIERAKLFLQTKRPLEFANESGDFIFDGFHCRENSSLIDFDFGLTGWDDASITAHFNNEEVFDVSFGD